MRSLVASILCVDQPFLFRLQRDCHRKQQNSSELEERLQYEVTCCGREGEERGKKEEEEKKKKLSSQASSRMNEGFCDG